MGTTKTTISTHVEDPILSAIDTIADHHDISRSLAIKLLLREALIGRSARYQHEILNAKLDKALSQLGIENIDEETIEDRFDLVTENTLPESTLDAELADVPIEEILLGPGGLSTGADEQKAKRDQSD